MHLYFVTQETALVRNEYFGPYWISELLPDMRKSCTIKPQLRMFNDLRWAKEPIRGGVSLPEADTEQYQGGQACLGLFWPFCRLFPSFPQLKVGQPEVPAFI